MSEFELSRIRSLDGQTLLVFNELMICRNAKEVATRLHMSQSAVSYTLTKLRELFGDPLFLRKPHGMEPTSRAHELEFPIRSLLNDARTLLDVRRMFDPKLHSRVFSISAPNYLTPVLSSQLSNRWENEAPKISVMFQRLGESMAISELRAGRVDLAIGRFEQASLPTGLSCDVLYEDQYCVVASQSHARIKEKLSAKAYQRERHVFANERSEVTEQESKTYHLPTSAFVVDDWTTALSIVSETQCLATCHKAIARHFAKRLNLKVLRPPFKPNLFKVSVLSRKNEDDSIRWLKEQIGSLKF